MAITFPDPSQSPWLAPNGVTYFWNVGGYWEAYWEASETSLDVYLSKKNDDTTVGQLTAEGGFVGSGSQLTDVDADSLQGAQPSVDPSNNTIVQRHSSGYIYANYFNTSPNDVSSGVTKVLVESGNDGFMRHGTQAAIRTFIGAGSGNGLDADKLDGQHRSESATGSTVVSRNGSGDIYCRLLRPNYANQSSMSGALAFRVNNSTDNYVRFCNSNGAVRDWLYAPAKNGSGATGTWSISILGSAERLRIASSGFGSASKRPVACFGNSSTPGTNDVSDIKYAGTVDKHPRVRGDGKLLTPGGTGTRSLSFRFLEREIGDENDASNFDAEGDYIGPVENIMEVFDTMREEVATAKAAIVELRARIAELEGS